MRPTYKPIYVSRWRQTHFQQVRISELEMAREKGLDRLSQLGSVRLVL
jgi:hypothetical protein